MVAKGEFPLRENCDPTDPEEAFLWMFAALPGVKGAPLIMPIDYYRLVSRRLWELGCRPVEEPTLEYVRPTGNEPNWMTSAGSWVPAGQAPKRTEEQQAREAVEAMTAQQQHELRVALTEGADPATPAGRVVASMTERQRNIVRAVLEER